MKNPGDYKTWVEISRQNILHNILEFHQHIGPKVKLMGVIKSNAYGHGLPEMAEIIESQVDWIGVDAIDEALELRKSGVNKPILVLGYTLESRLPELLKFDLNQVVANYRTLMKLDELTRKFDRPVKVHLKVETGTSRQGILLHKLPKFFELIKNNNHLILAGVSTHFANIEDTTDRTYADGQFAIYNQAVKYANESGFSSFVKHTACSAAIVAYPETHLDMVRLGISLYGMWSSGETQVSAKQKNVKLNLKPALTWKTKIAHIKKLPAGTAISYGCTEVINKDTKTAILPIGYYDGFDRGLSSVGNVLVHGKRCKVLGRVCMNMTVIDVEHLPNVELEDEVVIIGQQENEFISTEEVAKKINTINYEVTTRINPQIPRFIV